MRRCRPPLMCGRTSLVTMTGDTVKRAFLAANRVCVYPVTVADIFKQLSQCLDPSAEWEALAVAARKAQTFFELAKVPDGDRH